MTTAVTSVLECHCLCIAMYTNSSKYLISACTSSTWPPHLALIADMFKIFMLAVISESRRWVTGNCTNIFTSVVFSDAYNSLIVQTWGNSSAHSSLKSSEQNIWWCSNLQTMLIDVVNQGGFPMWHCLNGSQNSDLILARISCLSWCLLYQIG
jgi:hypothetical protein